MLTWACEGTWQTSAAFWVPLKGSSPLLSSFCYCTQTHTHTPSKSLARMTGDGQKQIMVIDRCLEMDLCVRVFMCVSEQRMGTEGSVQKLLIPSNREAMSLNQGQFRTVSPITNSPSPKHTHMQTVFALNNTPITKSDGRHIKPKCLLRREMNPSVWMKTLFYCDSMKFLHRIVNGSRQQSHPVKGWVQVTQTNSLSPSSQCIIHHKAPLIDG